jgi:hypothetical protein
MSRETEEIEREEEKGRERGERERREIGRVKTESGLMRT